MRLICKRNLKKNKYEGLNKYRTVTLGRCLSGNVLAIMLTTANLREASSARNILMRLSAIVTSVDFQATPCELIRQFRDQRSNVTSHSELLPDFVYLGSLY